MGWLAMVGAARIRAAALLCVALAFTSQDMASAQNGGRPSAASTPSPQAIRRDIRALDQALRRQESRQTALIVESASVRAEAEQLGRRLSDIDAEEDRIREARRNDRDAIEALVIARLFAERGGRSAAFAGAAAQAIAQDAVSQAASRRRSIDSLAADRTRLVDSQEALAARAIALAAEAADLQASLAVDRAERAALVSALAAAERRVAEQRARRTRRVSATPQQASLRAEPISAAQLRPMLTPSRAEIVRSYGARTAGGSQAQGVTIRTAPGATVTAPAAGEVGYAGPFRGYGQILILNVAGGRTLVLTGMETLSAAAGARVSPGQTLGVMSTSSSNPELYVEVRRNGQPIDPGPWLAAGRSAGGRTG